MHASDLFNTAYSARDVSGVLRALRLGRVDLYGDSYGSWFAQVFASRYPGQLRSVTLDSTYQVLDLDPWYTTTVVTARRAFDAGLPAVGGLRGGDRRRGRPGPGSARWQRRLARAPVSGETTTADGDRGPAHRDRADPGQPGQQRGLRPGRLPGPGRGRAGPARARRRGAAAADRRAVAGLRRHQLPAARSSATGCTSPCRCTDYVQLFSRTAPPAVAAPAVPRRRCAASRRAPSRRSALRPVDLAWTSTPRRTARCLRWPHARRG